ncbi:YncE family protein [Pseudomonas proteolytica]|uniref:YncE family protein n=1 Tax=Pseudomonas proteolytica TaxID=219574 RepID=UPI00320BB0F0
MSNELITQDFPPETFPLRLPHEGGGDAHFVEDLDTPYVANAVQPVVDADVGLGIRHLENFLYITFERWFSLNVGDVFKFYMGNVEVWGEITTGKDAEPRYQLRISYDNVPTGFLYPCYGSVLRAGSSTESTSPKQTWFVKKTRPGGVDKDPGEPYHSELVVSLPADLQGPGAVLVPERADLGVVLTIERYPNIRVRDTIELYWNGHLVLLRLDEDHASGAKPIEVQVEPEVLYRPNGSGLLTIRFRVVDEVLNYSGGPWMNAEQFQQQWSQSIRLESDLDPSLLERPYFLLNNLDITDVDFDTHSEGHFQVEVFVPTRLPDNSLIPAGTQIVVTLSGVDAVGTPITLQLPPFAVRINRSAFADVPNSFLKQLINGTLQIAYDLEFPLGNVLGTSRRLSVTIYGTLSTMPPVRIVEAEAGLVDPTLPYITVEFPEYIPYDRNYSVTLRMEAMRPDGAVEFYEQVLLAGDPPPPTRFRIVFNSDFKRFENINDVSVFYRVDDGKVGALGANLLTVRESERLTVQFGTRVASMPPPLLQGVDEHDNLDPADVIGQAILTLPYVRTFSGDKFIWNWTGTGIGGSTSGEIELNNGTAGRPVAFPVSTSFINPNFNGEIRIRYSLVPADGSPVLSSEVLIISVGVALGDLPRPEVEEASRHPDQVTPEALTAGATIKVTFAQMQTGDRVRACWKGVDSIGSHCETQDGNSIKTLFYTVPPEVVASNIQPGGRIIQVQYFLLRGTREIPSPVLSLLLLPLTTLSIPTIEGIGESPMLDLSRLAGHERTMLNTWHFTHAAQRMWMEYHGEYADGTPYFEATYTANLVTDDGVSQGILPPTPVDELRLLKDGSRLSIQFWVSFDRTSDKSNAVLFRIREHTIQALPGVLPHPFISGASGTGPDVTIANPLSIENTMRVSVAYAMAPTDRITLEMIFQSGTPYTVSLDGQAGGTVVFSLSNAILARCVNSTVCVRYSVLRNGQTIPSHLQTVTFGTIAAANLPRPLINNIANGGTLDLTAFTGNATASVAKWRLSAAKQRVWLTCSSAGVADLDVLDGVEISATEAANGLVNIPVQRNWLAALPTGSQLTVTCKVTFDGSPDKAQAVDFQSATYSVVSAPRIIKTITTGGRPLYLSASPDGSRVYVSGDSLGIAVIDTASNQIIHSIRDANSNFAIHPDGTRLYVNTSSMALATINTSTFARTEVIIDVSMRIFVFNASGSRLYGVNADTGSVIVFDTATNRVIQQISIQWANTITFNPRNNRLYVFRSNTNDIVIIDANTNQVITHVPIQAFYSAYSPYTSRIYGSGWQVLYILNTDTNTLVKTINIDRPRVAFGTTTEHAYVTSRNANSLSVMNIHTETITSTITGFHDPANIITLPGKPIAYVANIGGGSVSVVQL